MTSYSRNSTSKQKKKVNSKLLTLAEPPGLNTPHANSGATRMDTGCPIAVSIPLSLADKGDAILDQQIHTVQTPL